MSLFSCTTKREQKFASELTSTLETYKKLLVSSKKNLDRFYAKMHRETEELINEDLVLFEGEKNLRSLMVYNHNKLNELKSDEDKLKALNKYNNFLAALEKGNVSAKQVTSNINSHAESLSLFQSEIKKIADGMSVKDQIAFLDEAIKLIDKKLAPQKAKEETK